MKDAPLSRGPTVSGAAARALAEDQVRQMLFVFREPASISAAAARLGSTVERLHHHVGKLVRLKLLETCATVPRAGRAIKLYRAVSDCFFIRDEHLGEAFSADLNRQLRDRLAMAHFRSGGGTTLRISATGVETIRTPGEAGKADVSELWLHLLIRPQDRVRLESELNDLLMRYDRPDDPLAVATLLHFAAVPVNG